MNKWDLDVPQKELFPTNDDITTADVPTQEERMAMNEDTLEFRELTNEQEVHKRKRLLLRNPWTCRKTRNSSSTTWTMCRSHKI